MIGCCIIKDKFNDLQPHTVHQALRSSCYALMMGNDQNERELPIHKEEVQDFYIGVYPVTNAQYVVFLDDYGSNKVKASMYAGQEMVFADSWGM